MRRETCQSDTSRSGEFQSGYRSTAISMSTMHLANRLYFCMKAGQKHFPPGRMSLVKSEFSQATAWLIRPFIRLLKRASGILCHCALTPIILRIVSPRSRSSERPLPHISFSFSSVPFSPIRHRTDSVWRHPSNKGGMANGSTTAEVRIP